LGDIGHIGSLEIRPPAARPGRIRPPRGDLFLDVEPYARRIELLGAEIVCGLEGELTGRAGRGGREEREQEGSRGGQAIRNPAKVAGSRCRLSLVAERFSLKHPRKSVLEKVIPQRLPVLRGTLVVTNVNFVHVTISLRRALHDLASQPQ